MSDSEMCVRCGHLRRCHVTLDDATWGAWCPQHPKPFPVHDFVPQTEAEP